MVFGCTIVKSHDTALIIQFVVGCFVPLELVLLVILVLSFEGVLQLIEYPIILSPLVEWRLLHIASLFCYFLLFYVLETCSLKI